MSNTPPPPDEFLELVHHDRRVTPNLIGLCAGYSLGVWRCDGLASHLMEWLPEFCLKHSELTALTSGNMIQIVRRAANIVFTSKKFQKRGEFGEVLLHAAIRQVHNSIPAVSKIYYKSSSNDTVKGFDAVHVVPIGSSLELWLGEVKFYGSITKAIADVCKELTIHLGTDYLKSEFSLILNKIDPSWPYADKLKTLLHPNSSLDKVFANACVPVLLTYDSDTVKKHSITDAAYLKAIAEEFRVHWQSFQSKSPKGLSVRIHLILVPLNTKKLLQESLFKKLEHLQAI